MTIRFRAYGIGIPTQVNGTYTLENGTSVQGAIQTILKDTRVLEHVEAFPDSILLVNGAPAVPQTVLKEGDVLSVMRTLSGG